MYLPGYGVDIPDVIMFQPGGPFSNTYSVDPNNWLYGSGPDTGATQGVYDSYFTGAGGGGGSVGNVGNSGSSNSMGGFLSGLFGGGGETGGFSIGSPITFDPTTGLPTGSWGNQFVFDPTYANRLANASNDPNLTSDTGNTTNQLPIDTTGILGTILGSIPGLASGSGGILSKILQGLTGKTGVSSGLTSQLTSLLGGVGLPLYGALQSSNQQDWNNAAKISTLNYLQRLGGNAEGQISGQQNTYLPQMASQIGTSQGLLNATQGQASDNINRALGNIQGAFGPKDPYAAIPGLSDVINQLNGIQGTGGSALSNLQNNLTSGPLTGGLNNAMQISAGNTPIQGQLSSLAAMLAGGGPGVLGQPNAATQQAQSVAGQILGKNPLLSMDQVRSMAIDQNATQSLNAMNALRKQELARTGVTGPAIASGAQNELLGSGMDQALQNQAAGLTNATLGQQNLQNQLYNTGASLYGSAQNAGLNQQQLALQQILGGAGLLSGNQNSQISALNALSNLGGTQNQGYGTLGSLLGTLSGSAQGAGGLLTGAQNTGNTQTNDLYSQLNNLIGNQLGLGNQAQQGLFGAAAFPQNTANNNYNLLQSLASGNVGLFGNVPAMTTSNNLFSGLVK